MKQLFTHVVLAGFLMMGSLSVWASPETEALVRKNTNEVLEALKADSSQVYALVNEILLPHFDFERMSKLVLSKHWRRTTEDQRKRFANEFRGLLVRTYSSALVEAAGKVRKIDYSSKDKKKRNRLQSIVYTKVYQRGKPKPIEANYDMYYHDDKWQVYNVTVGGVSLVTNYRTEFSNDIKKIGVEGLINKIKNQNSK
jgi:phospholipid transport system substrate-binding protein